MVWAGWQSRPASVPFSSCHGFSFSAISYISESPGNEGRRPRRRAVRRRSFVEFRAWRPAVRSSLRIQMPLRDDKFKLTTSSRGILGSWKNSDSWFVAHKSLPLYSKKLWWNLATGRLNQVGPYAQDRWPCIFCDLWLRYSHRLYAIP